MQEYVVGFRIFDGRSLQSEDGGLCDPFVEVECAGYTYTTEVLEGRSTSSLVPWNEGCIWPSILLSPDEFSSVYIQFSVYAKYWWTRNYLIGKASLQLAFINRRKRCLFARKWITLRREDSTGCTGMLQVTVYALRPGQPAPSSTEQEQLDEEPENDEAGGGGGDDDDIRKAVLKPTVQAPAGAPHHVRITLSRVEDLVDLGGLGGAPSPYITVEFAGCIVPTSTAARVKMFAFNEEILIPVVTPVYEDTIILKLWSYNMFSPDELLAQGMISFSELRNSSLKPRWFNLYGWNSDEVPNLTDITASGSAPDPNSFKGRLLISGRVERLAGDDQLQKACCQGARPLSDPDIFMLALFTDVYMVTGAEGRHCCVEVSFGPENGATQWVSYDTEKMSLAPEDSAALQVMPDEDDEVQAVSEEVNSFSFTQKAGRIQPLLVMATEDPDSQPYVMVNVYTEGYTQKRRRIAYAKCTLAEWPKYDHGNPMKPRFVALESLPDLKGRIRNPPSVLIAIEKHSTDDVVRHMRKTIKPLPYIVRAYCFLGRHIKHEDLRQDCEPSSYSLRASCAGMAMSTEMMPGPRPRWMQSLDLKVILCSDSPKVPPTIEPITVTLVEGQLLRNCDLGKAVCVYTHMRRRDRLHNWEPYTLEPQWVQVMGGKYGQQAVGEVLVAFELFLWRDREELKLQPKEMWPQPEEVFDRRHHFSRLRKATLHFSLQGLRDLAPLPNIQSLGFAGGSGHVTRPRVTVGVRSFCKEASWMDEKELSFDYRKLVPGGDEKVQADNLKSWTSKAIDEQERSNFEFLQVGKMRVLIPDNRLLQPYLVIGVWEQPSEGLVSSALGYGSPTHIGESLQSLSHVLPCCWLDGVTLDKPYAEQKELIAERLEQAKDAGYVREHYQQLTPEELRRRVAWMKDALAVVPLRVKITSARGLAGIEALDDVEPYCTCETVGKPNSRIRTPAISDKSRAVWNFESKIVDYAPGDFLLFCLLDRDEVSLEEASAKAVLHADQFYPGGFDGEVPLLIGQDCAYLKVQVTLGIESNTSKRKMIGAEADKHEFLNAEALPLPLRESDQKRSLRPIPIDQLNVTGERPFTPRKGEALATIGAKNARRGVRCRLENSVAFPFVHDFWFKSLPLLRNHDIVEQNDEELDWNYRPGLTFGFVKCSFKLVDGWEHEEHGDKDARAVEDEGAAHNEEEEEDTDELKLRRSFNFDHLLNSYAFNEKAFLKKFKLRENVPSRVRVRLYFVKAVCIFGRAGSFADPYIAYQLGHNVNVAMKNFVRSSTNTPDFYLFQQHDVQLPDDGRLEVAVMDLAGTTIGSTVIDLEDRWHSDMWKQYNEKGVVPIETRPLFTSECLDKHRGSLEMWVEMVESTKASEVKPSDLRRPAEQEIEVRLVIWGASGIPPTKDGYTNVKISTTLDCKEYGSSEFEYPKIQETDVHFICKDGRAVFAWRMVYPRIQTPVFSCMIQFNLYHYELMAGDTFLGTFTLDVKKYLMKVCQDLMARTLGPADLEFQLSDSSDGPDAGNPAPTLSVSLYVLTQGEATRKQQGLGRNEPNDDPQLITPTEGREWGDYLASMGFAWPDFGLWKKLLPLVIALFGFLVSVIALRQMGIL